MIYADYVLLINTILKRNFGDIFEIQEVGDSQTQIDIQIPNYRNLKALYEFENGMDFMLIENHNALIYSQMIHDIRCGNNDECSSSKLENHYGKHLDKKLTKKGFGNLFPSFCMENAYKAFDIINKIGSIDIRDNTFDTDMEPLYREREYIDLDIFNSFMCKLTDENFKRISKCFFFVSDKKYPIMKSHTDQKKPIQEEEEEIYVPVEKETIEFDFMSQNKVDRCFQTTTPNNSPHNQIKEYLGYGLQILEEEDNTETSDLIKEEVKNHVINEIERKSSITHTPRQVSTNKTTSSWRKKIQNKKQKLKSFVSSMIRKKNKIQIDIQPNYEVSK